MAKIILTGLNGYGGHIVKQILEDTSDENALVAVISRNPKSSIYYQKLLEKKVTFYSDIETCLENEHVDLAIITTPMHIHQREVMAALRKGVSVYCEKPLTPTVEQALEIKQLAIETKCLVGVGFQWSFSKGILQLKRDLIAQRYGKINKMRTLVKWSRPKSYYEQSDWKGRVCTQTGVQVYESVLSNGASHFMHNLLFLAGDELHKAAYPEVIEGECYRAHAIETFDTTRVRMITKSGTELLYLATVVADQSESPKFEIICDEATIYYPGDQDGHIIAVLKNGDRVVYNNPDEDRFMHYKEVIACRKNDGQIVCDIDTILPERTVANTVMKQEKSSLIPAKLIKEDSEKIWVENISAILDECYETDKTLEMFFGRC